MYQKFLMWCVLFWVLVPLQADSGQDPWVEWSIKIGGSGDERALDIKEAFDNCIIVSGFTTSNSFGGEDIYVCKLNKKGNVLWSKNFGGAADERADAILPTEDFGCLVAGGTRSFSQGEDDMWIIKLNAQGDKEWEKFIGGQGRDGAIDLLKTSDNHIMVLGITSSLGAGNTDVYLIKMDTAGNVLWSKTYGGSDYDWSWNIKETLDGGFIIAGDTRSFGAGQLDGYMIKTDNSGNLEWQKTFGGIYDDGSHGIIIAEDGCYFVTGSTKSFSKSYCDYFICKLNNSGEQLWYKTYGGNGFNYNYSGFKTSDRGLFLSGFSNSSSGTYDWYAVKTDLDGVILWEKVVNGGGTEFMYEACETSDHGFLGAGYSEFYKHEPSAALEETENYFTPWLKNSRLGKKDIFIVKLSTNPSTYSHLIGCWPNLGLWYRDSITKKYTKLSEYEPLQITCGDFSGDGQDDLIGWFDFGIWVWYSQKNYWEKLQINTTGLSSISAADFNGDGVDEMLGSWDVGTWYYDFVAKKWHKFVNSKFDKIATGYFDDDLVKDFTGVWNNKLWVWYSQTNSWKSIKTANEFKWITVGNIKENLLDEIIVSMDNNVWYYDQINQNWFFISKGADMIAAGDINGKGFSDLIGVWANHGIPGIWTLYSETQIWEKIDKKTPSYIATGKIYIQSQIQK